VGERSEAPFFLPVKGGRRLRGTEGAFFSIPLSKPGSQEKKKNDSSTALSGREVRPFPPKKKKTESAKKERILFGSSTVGKRGRGRSSRHEQRGGIHAFSIGMTATRGWLGYVAERRQKSQPHGFHQGSVVVVRSGVETDFQKRNVGKEAFGADFDFARRKRHCPEREKGAIVMGGEVLSHLEGENHAIYAGRPGKRRTRRARTGCNLRYCDAIGYEKGAWK